MLAMVAAVTIADDPVLVLGPALAHHVLAISSDWSAYFQALLLKRQPVPGGSGNGTMGSRVLAHGRLIDDPVDQFRPEHLRQHANPDLDGVLTRGGTVSV